MTTADFETEAGKFLNEVQEMLRLKGADYATAADPLDNFKAAALILGADPLQVWLVYAAKHFLAVRGYLEKGRAASEPIRGRFLDLAAYAVLGSMLVGDKGGTTSHA